MKLIDTENEVRGAKKKTKLAIQMRIFTCSPAYGFMCWCVTHTVAHINYYYRIHFHLMQTVEMSNQEITYTSTC